jgi:hypothetical protein
MTALYRATTHRQPADTRTPLPWTQLGNYIPNQRYAEALLDNLDAMREVTDEVFIDWDAAQRR